MRPDLEEWWRLVKPVMKPRGAVVCTASQPFTSLLVVSNLKWFRYEWVWDKTTVSGFLDANHKPLKRHEGILVFSDKRSLFFPVWGVGEPYEAIRSGASPLYGAHNRIETINNGRRYPTSIIQFSMSNSDKDHPTQKPVALFEYLIRTYTRPGDLVVDPFVGSGTTALAARNTGRHYVVGDLDAGYCEIARQRLAEPYTLPMFADDPAPDAPAVQVSLFGEE